MTPREFCEKAKKEKMLKGWDINFTPSLLKDIGFLNQEYRYSDFFNLNCLLLQKGADRKEKPLLAEKEEVALRKLANILYPDLIRQIQDRKGWSLITILRLIPEFSSWVQFEREKYGIDPQEIVRVLLKKISKRDQDLARKIIKETDWKIDAVISDSKSLSKYTSAPRDQWPKEIRKFNKHIIFLFAKELLISKFIFFDLGVGNLQDLEKDIKDMCLNKLGLPLNYVGYVKRYILLDEIDRLDNLLFPHGSELPGIDFCIDKPESKESNKQKFEPYICLKIFGTTSKNKAEFAVDYIYKQGFIKKLPSYKFRSYFYNPKQDAKIILRKAIYTFLRESQKLTPRQIIRVMEQVGVKGLKQRNIPRDISRLRNAFSIMHPTT